MHYAGTAFKKTPLNAAKATHNVVFNRPKSNQHKSRLFPLFCYAYIKDANNSYMNDDQNPQELSEGQKQFQESIAKNAGKDIDPSTQEELNKPFSSGSTQLSNEDQAFLDDLIGKINNGEIELHKPSSILNQDIYDGLSGEDQAKTDFFLNSTLFVIRQVNDFYQSDYDNNSDMMINMVHELRLKKETLENEVGDVLKI